MEPSSSPPGARRRRWLGGIALALAASMLVAGETVLKGNLRPLPWLCYWIVCVLLTGVAIVSAFLDLRSVARRTRDEQRKLIETTIKDIVQDVRHRPPNPPSRQA